MWAPGAGCGPQCPAPAGMRGATPVGFPSICLLTIVRLRYSYDSMLSRRPDRQFYHTSAGESPRGVGSFAYPRGARPRPPPRAACGTIGPTHDRSAKMPEQPTGTVTFLFTEVEGSAQLWEQQPAATQAALDRHHLILRTAIAQQAGSIFKTLNEGVCAAFPTAPDALAAALAAQRELAAESWALAAPLQVRMALHTGTVEERAGDYLGPPLNRNARLLAAGHGGQILLSLATQELVRDQLPGGTYLQDLGEHRLRDLTRPEHLFQLVAADRPAQFPALQTLDARPNNLPAQSTDLIGREPEVAAVAALLRRKEIRLVTLTGPGGTGKTRLGLQVAAELLDAFPAGCWFVPLAAVADPALVAPTVAATLGIRETAGQALTARLKDYLGEIGR